MEELLETILTKMSSINKPQKKALMIILMSFVYYQGRSNFRNLARYCSLSETTLSRWARRTFDYQVFNTILLEQEVLDKNHERVAALDASFIRKSGHKTEGIGRFHSGCSGRTERGLEMSLLSVIDLDRHTGFSLLARQTEIRNESGNRIDQAIEQVKDCQKQLQTLKVKDLTVDAWYSKHRFVNSIFELGIHIVGKLRIDARLHFELEESIQKKKSPGRPRLYGPKLSLTDLSRLKKTELSNSSIDLYSGVLYSKSLKRKIKVVILVNTTMQKTKAILYSTNEQESPESVLKKYKSRFQIEFLIRDAKQHTGLEHCQARSYTATENHFNNALVAINLLKVEDIKSTNSTKEKVISIASWRRRKTNTNLASIIINMLGFEPNMKKIKEIYEFVGSFGCIAA